MSLHLSLSPDALRQLQHEQRRHKISSALACLVFVSLVGFVLYSTYKLTMPQAESGMVAYIEPNEEAPAQKKPTPTKQQRPVSSSPNITIQTIVAAAPTQVVMPELDQNLPSDNIGTGLVIGVGPGIGSATSPSNEPMGSTQPSGSALEGTFYDLKQTRSGASTGIVYNPATGGINGAGLSKAQAVLGEFFARNWSPSVLNKYYQAPQKLYASSFYLPNCAASVGPLCFKQAAVEPSAWVVVYRGKVRAPYSGKIRFVGAGDDVLAVRFGGELVLEAGWSLPSHYNSKSSNHHADFGSLGTSKNYQDALRAGSLAKRKDWQLRAYPKAGSYNQSLGGLTAGKTIEVKEGREYPIEILISEIPGGLFGMLLLVEDLSSPSEQLELFRTSFSNPTGPKVGQKLIESYDAMPPSYKKKNPRPARMGEFVPYAEDSYIWPATP